MLQTMQLQRSHRNRTMSQSASGQAVNQTGLPDGLKNGIEALSGIPLDDVRVHANSAKPAQLEAFAYAQGKDIHLAPGQERYLPHEAWHIVQQKQGRVAPTTHIGETPVNDNLGLENEASQMGAKALKSYAQLQSSAPTLRPNQEKGAFTTRQNQSAGVTGAAPAQLGKTNKGKHYKDKHFNFKLRKKQPVFNLHINELVDGLDSDRNELERFETLQSTGKTTYRKTPITKIIKKTKADITEKVGELNATQYMLRQYPTAKLVLGYSKGIGLDQVYEHGNDMIVVEAKGPGAKLGTSDRKGKQMSYPWILETSKGMSDKALGKKIRKKHKQGRLIRLVITSTPSGNAPKKVDEF